MHADKPISTLRTTASRMRGFFSARRLDADFQDELASHLSLLEEENLRRGLTPGEARRQARLRLGADASLRETHHDLRGLPWLESLLQDVRFGLRMLRKSPGFTAVAILTLTLGIGANTAIFSLIDAVLLRSLPIATPSQVVLLKWSARRAPKINGYLSAGDCVDNLKPGAKNPSGCAFSEPLFREIERSGIFLSAAAYASTGQLDLAGNGPPSVISGQFVSGNFFRTLGLNAAAGRLIDSNDDVPAAAPVAVLSYGYWQSAFGGSRGAIGRTIQLDNGAFMIVGVAPPHFSGLTPGSDFDVWIPLANAHLISSPVPWRNRQDDVTFWWLTIVARLKSSTPLPEAQAAVSGLFRNEMLHGSVALFDAGSEPPGRPESRAKSAIASAANPAAAPKPARRQTLARSAHSAPGEKAPRAVQPKSQTSPQQYFGEPIAKSLSTAADNPTISLLLAQSGLSGDRAIYANPLYVLMIAVGLILLIACANLAGLMLARSTARQKEIAVRLALGAAKRRIVCQLFTESLLLAALGGALGIVFAVWGVHAIVSFVATNQPRSLALAAAPDLRVLAFTVAVSVFTGILFGLAPAFRSSRLDLVPALKDAEGGSPKTRRSFARWLSVGSSLVVAQVALAMIVLVGAGLLVRTLRNLRTLNPGFNARNLVIFRIDPSLLGLNAAQIDSLYRDLQGRLSETPGIRSASYSQITLLSNGSWRMGFQWPGTPKDRVSFADRLSVGPNFFSTMQIPLLLGRGFGAPDFELAASNAGSTPTSAPTPAIVNQAFVSRYLGKTNPIGREFVQAPVNPFGPSTPHYEIMGVARDAKYASLRTAIHPTIYIPQSGSGATFEVRTAAGPQAILPAIRKAVSEVNSELPLYDLETQSQQIDRLLFEERLVAGMSSFLGVLALTLACIGLYGLLAYETTRRTREIGIRIALGAQPRVILRLVVARGIALVAVGGIAGIAVTFAIMRYISSFLFGVAPTDPSTLAAIATLLLLVAIFACYIPARRAMRVDPMVALRHE